MDIDGWCTPIFGMRTINHMLIQCSAGIQRSTSTVVEKHTILTTPNPPLSLTLAQSGTSHHT